MVNDKTRTAFDVKIKEHISNKKRIQEALLPYYTFGNIEIPSELMLLQLSNVPLMSATDNVLLGAVYAPPEQSTYYNNAVFDEIETCLVSFDIENIVLAGDMNARTAQLDDFIDDENVTDFSGDLITDEMALFALASLEADIHLILQGTILGIL